MIREYLVISISHDLFRLNFVNQNTEELIENNKKTGFFQSVSTSESIRFIMYGYNHKPQINIKAIKTQTNVEVFINWFKLLKFALTLIPLSSILKTKLIIISKIRKLKNKFDISKTVTIFDSINLHQFKPYAH